MTLRSTNWFVVFIGSIVFSLLLNACDKAEQANKQKPVKNIAKWAEYINAHTRGTISKYDTISIRFVNDIVVDDRVGTTAEQVLQVTPAIAGELIFNNKREIVLIPQSPLPSGQQYRFTLHTDTLSGFDKELKTYSFDVNVIKQSFEVALHGVNAQLDSQDALQATGLVTTADKEEADKIEKVLSADFKGKTLGINWQHNPNGRQHSYTIPGIKRETDQTQVILKWNGQVIGVDHQGERKIDIPAKGDFKVAHIRVVSGDKQYVEVQLTDIVDPKQNLNGLVQFSQGKFRTQADGSTIKIYPDAGLTGEVNVTLDASIRSRLGNKLGEQVVRSVIFTSQKPQVRFTGSGVILPENQLLTIPFETINVHSVEVSAMLIYENNVGRFLQDNQLEGSSNVHRVGRYLWSKTIKLDSPKADKWNRFTFDATDLLKSHPGGLFRIGLRINRGHSTYSCSEDDNAVPVAPLAPLINYDEENSRESSNWDYYEEYYNQNYYNQWSERENPCKDAYYRFDSNVSANRNFMASNIGLLAKRGEDNHIHMVATELSTAKPLSNVKIELRNFQNQLLKTVTTDQNGFADANLDNRPFYITARKGDQIGYLKLSVGSALPTSHFNVGGEKVKQGVKGIIYAERGVWRPGDDMYLTFVLEDKQDRIPDQHPVTMELYNPKGQLIESKTNSSPVGDFYKFKFTTSEDAETGNWKVQAILGGNKFHKTLKVETVVPNRLKVELGFPDKELYADKMPVSMKLDSQWLHGATASGLNSDVAVNLIPTKTSFERNVDYQFDDPARQFGSEKLTLFEGQLDDKGHVEFSSEIRPSTKPPGKLSAYFQSRVFEKGGAFSTSSSSIPFHPYENYVGIRLPKGDAARNMLLTDKKHEVEIASLSATGEPVSLERVQVTLYKIDWRWWWDQSGDSLAQYASAYYNQHIQQGVISTKDGQGKWEFEIKYPEWGRYLIRACDLADSNHCTGQVFYIDWPAWAGKAREQKGVGATALSFTADKPKYQVGDKATIKLPETSEGRALVSIENGSRLISQQWVEVSKDKQNFNIAITEDMAPNVYVSVSLIQPHASKDNDRPIRLYGVIPLLVEDPKTKLTPQLIAADEWKPESKVDIEVSESNGKAMTYTIAVVDEGLLGLTNFKTPNLHKYFYEKEALGVKTWDLFDEVTGAYGGELEKLLSLGGDTEADEDQGGKKKRRFPPVVQFLGPFQLQAGSTDKHTLTIPQYLGSVRVMVVAGDKGAYGLTDKSVFVRQPLGLLATLPRVLGPDENLSVPVSIFVMDEKIKQANVILEADEHFEIMDKKAMLLDFNEPGEKIGFINLKVKDKLGKGHLKFVARSGEHQAQSDVYIDIRSANVATTRFQTQAIQPGQAWETEVKPHGIGGTNVVTLEMSAIPPLDLEGRLKYLIRYPHGCLEQTTSATFPQLYLDNVMKLTPEQKDSIQKHVEIAIHKIQRYQQLNGAFSYWPGHNFYNSWSNTYAGHFLIEAERLGHYVPPQLLSNWVNYQRSIASSYVTGTLEQSSLDQAYRLYVLAVANRPELGAMNRLREQTGLPNTARWLLAAAYSRSGLSDVASELIRDADFSVDDYRVAGPTLGSALRDKAIILESLSLMKRWDEAKPLADAIAKELSADRWYSTQSVAFGLIAMGHFVGEGAGESGIRFEQGMADNPGVMINSDKPVYLHPIADFPDDGSKVRIKNPGDRVLYARLSVSGIPRAGEERSSRSGIGLRVQYFDLEGHALDISRLRQGTDLIAQISVRNHSDFNLEHLALSHIVPSGWQIHNPRMVQDENDVLPSIDYQDIRDDRVYTYFDLKRSEEKTFKVQLNASFLGHYYLPGIHVEAMYDATKHARSKGKWVDVVK